MDGINWNQIKKILDESYLLRGWAHPNHFDTHNCIVYNEKEDNYFIYVRDNKPEKRFVQYSITKDFNEFTKCNSININDNNDMLLYTPGVFKYENSDYYLSIPSVNGSSYDIKSNSTLMVSKDGINFDILTKELFNNNESSMNINSIVPSPDNLKMYIYCHSSIIENGYVSCHSFEKDRIQKIVCNGYGFVKTDLIKLYSKLYINYSTFDEGFINIQIIDTNKNILLDSIKVSNNSYFHEVIWNNGNIITPGNYYIQINMYNCNFYSFSYDNYV